MKVPPLVLGAIAGLSAAALLSIPAADALRDLRAVRADRATLAQAAAGPLPSRTIVIDGEATLARSPGTAADLLAGRLRAAAARAGVLVETATPVPAAGLARVRLSVSGSEDAVLGFADTLERGRPLARFATWQATAKGRVVTLTGEVVSPWQ